MKKVKLKTRTDFVFELFTEKDNREWFAHMRKQRIHEALESNNVFVTDDRKGKVVGCLVWSVFKANSHIYIGRRGDFQIKQIVVSEKGKGIAHSLFKRAINKAKQAGCPRIVRTVREDNKRAQGFYKKMGMQKIKTTTVITKTTKKEMVYFEFSLQLKKEIDTLV